MTEKEARQLLPLTVVMWDKNPDDLGTVRETNYLGVLIDWEIEGACWIAFQDMQPISLR